MTQDPAVARARFEALARSTANALADAKAEWPRKAKARAKKAPSDAARAAFELAVALPREERAWLAAQL